ncbi:MAG TPA: M20/M25/M40 family metallo-hydrolase [Solirubrobacteraceae bacterium]|nr:M20/M25/M40 family metallo-hydrolase [Solirubrobacteraceae bacterium]
MTAALDAAALARDTAALVRVPSVTGDERAALERAGEIAERLGLEPELERHDLAALRAHPGHPGEEAPRDELWGLTVRSPGEGPRICLNGHVDVVGPGDQPWERDPWSGAIEGGHVHGRGSADMKGGVVAALHAMAAVAGEARCEVVLQAVASEEDGGLGTFAALERDDRFDAALVPEPTGFALAIAQAGALTFAGVVPGVSAHAAVRLEGVSAIDRYVDVHRALAEHERRLNTDVEDPLMARLALPYPLSVGRVRGGRWSSQVPDRVEFEGRLGVRVGEAVQEARAAFEAVVREACPEAEVAWTGGQFAPGATAADHPFCALVRDAAAEVLGTPPPLVGVPYGSDMRQFCARGIPAVMFGPRGLERAHAVDERVLVDDVLAVARTIARVLLRSAA